MSRFLFYVLPIIVVFWGCDLLWPTPDGPEAEDLEVVGTQVEPDFQETGEFGIQAIPLDPEDEAILTTDIGVEVEMEHPHPPSGAATVEGHIETDPEPEDTKEPTEDPLVASINFDGSGSLNDHDEPERNRVKGGQAFVDEMERIGIDYEAGVFEYRGSCAPDALNFQCTDLLQDYTDDANQLKGAMEQLGANGDTPTYGSLLEILGYVENQRSSADYENIVVLFSDGKPNDQNLQARRENVCRIARQRNIPIFAVGLGPGSDLDSRFVEPEAVEEMNRIAACSDGAYVGVDPNAPRQSAVDAFSNFGTAAAKGFVSIKVKIVSGLEDFGTGDTAEGVLRITSGGQTVEAPFSFRVPALDPSFEAFKNSDLLEDED